MSQFASLNNIKLPKNRRQVNQAEVTRIAEDMKIHGVHDALTVTGPVNHYYTLIDGLHRWHAAKSLGYREVPINVVKLQQ